MVDRLLSNLDPHNLEEWKTLAKTNKRSAMVLLLQDILEAGPESIEHLYDTLCNMLEFEIIDKIRQSAGRLDTNGLHANSKSNLLT